APDLDTGIPPRGAPDPSFRLRAAGQNGLVLRLGDAVEMPGAEPVAPRTACDPASYQIEHYRYEYTGAYGSPELDRTRVAIERVEQSADGRTIDLITAPLVKDRVYLIHPRGVRSAKGEALVNPLGAYTLNEIPA